MEQLSAELEAALVRELARCYDNSNWQRFGSRLARPLLAVVDSATRLGQWTRASRRLELQRQLVLERPWPEVLAVLEHEMAHQFVDEVLGIHDETAHGPRFQRVCEERGIDARAGGAPIVRGDATDATAAATQRTIDRIRKLLALAGSPNQHEAEAAMKRAHELMLRHNIEQVPVKREFEVRHLGEPFRRANTVETQIVCLLAELFFVEAITIPVYLPRSGVRAQTYEIAGTPANLEMACHVYAFLLATTERLWRDNRRDARIRNGRDRVPYQIGVIRGFREKLLGERVQLRSVGLVWVGDPGLDQFHRRRHPRVVTRRHAAVRNGEAHRAGHEAGREVVLHKPVTATGGGGRGLLGSG
jgi:hypothetical protein